MKKSTKKSATVWVYPSSRNNYRLIQGPVVNEENINVEMIRTTSEIQRQEFYWFDKKHSFISIEKFKVILILQEKSSRNRIRSFLEGVFFSRC